MRDCSNAGPEREVIVLAPCAMQHPNYRQIVSMARARAAQLFEVDAWRRKFMTLAIYTRATPGEPWLAPGGMTVPGLSEALSHEEREEYVRDEAEARSRDGVDGWTLVWWGTEQEMADMSDATFSEL